MKKLFRNIVILFFPLLFVFAINESSRLENKRKRFLSQNTKTINSNKPLKTKCTWACHNNTVYCKENHVKYLRNQFYFTDQIYFGIINTLQNTGNYGLANIVLLIIVFPLLIYFMLLKTLNNFSKIKNLKNESVRTNT